MTTTFGGAYRRLEKDIDPQKVYTAFLSTGYDGMSLQQMADLIWMPVEQLSACYPSKYDLWYAALCHASQDLADDVTAQVTAKGPLQRLRQACYATVDYSLRYPNTYNFIIMPRSKEMETPDSPAPGVIAFRVLFQRLVRQCIKAGLFAEHSPELVSQALISIFNSLAELRQNIQRIPWSDQLTSHIIETYLTGLRFVIPRQQAEVE